MDKNIIDALVSSFTWSSRPSLTVTTARERAVSENLIRIEQVLSTADPLRAVWSEMPTAAARRIGGAPATNYVLNRGEPDLTLGFLHRSMAAELARLSGARAFPRVWAALGDHGWDETGRPVRAPTLHGTIIPIDFSSPFLNINLCFSDEGFTEATPNSSADSARVVQELTSAVALLEQVSTAARDFVLSATMSIAVHIRPIPAFSSGSSPELPGRIDLLNPDHKLADTCHLADSILHEAMHGAMYDLESTHGAFVANHEHKLLTSPWTGRELGLHTFIHACFVWYGLFNFWKLSSCRSSGASSFQVTAASGYAHADPASMVGSTDVPPDIVRAIGEMQRHVRAGLA